MKKKKFTLCFIYMFVATLFGAISFAWLGTNDNTISVNITGSLVSDYFHCGSGTESDPFIITRPIHYYHMVEFFQRNQRVPTRLYTEVNGERLYVNFGTDRLYFQIGCPEGELYNPHGYDKSSTTPDTEYYVFDYNNQGDVIKVDDPNSDNPEDTIDGKSQVLNMAYYSNSNALMPLGSSDKPFYGKLDGKGLTISNLNIIASNTVNDEVRTTSDVGIFGVVRCDYSNSNDNLTFGSAVQDIYFDNVEISLEGATKNSNCTITGSTHEDNNIYIGYLVGHLYAYENALNRDYNTNQVGTPSYPVTNVYVNNTTITGGTSDSAVCNYGYFGHIDILDGEKSISLSDQVNDFEGGGEGDEGWGGSIDITSLYNRLNAQIGTYGTRIQYYPTTETIVAGSDTSTTAKVSMDTDDSEETNSGSISKYYWSANTTGSSTSFTAEANLTGGTIIGSKSSSLIGLFSGNSCIYIYGLNSTGTTHTTTYSKSGDSIAAYYINSNGLYLTIDENNDITSEAISKNASKFVFNAKATTGNITVGTIFNIGDNTANYLIPVLDSTTNDYTSIGVTNSNATAVVYPWTNEVKADGGELIYYTDSNGIAHYLVYDEGWKLTSSIFYTVISDGNNHYLSASSNGVKNVSNVNDSVFWYVIDDDNNEDKVSFSFLSGSRRYYLTVVNGQLGVSVVETTWNRVEDPNDSTKHTYYTTQNGNNYYLVYDNGWKAKELSGKVIVNNGHYMFADKDQVKSTSSENATLFHVAETDTTIEIYSYFDGTKYYLSNTGTDLKMVSSPIVWNKDSIGYYRNVTYEGVTTKYYLTYQDGWKATPLSGYRINDGTHYLTYQAKVIDGKTTYQITSTNEANSTLWQYNNNRVYAIIGENYYYLTLNKDGELILLLNDYNSCWLYDNKGYYTVKNSVDNFYLTYDKGFKVAILNGFKIHDGNGHYLSKSGTTVTSTNEDNATIWKLTNGDIYNTVGKTSRIYTIVGTSRYYLYENNGLLALYQAGIGNLLDLTIESQEFVGMNQNPDTMDIYYTKDTQTFTVLTDSQYIGKDPHDQLTQTVYLVAGKTYYFHIEYEVSAPNNGESICLYYSLVDDYYGENVTSHNDKKTTFWNYTGSDESFIVTQTGNYKFRLDNDTQLTKFNVSNFYIGEQPYCPLNMWTNDGTGFCLTLDGNTVYLNYDQNTNKWGFAFTGGSYIYYPVGNTSYYLTATGTDVSFTTDTNYASKWFFIGDKIFTLIGSTIYYFSYEDVVKQYIVNDSIINGNELSLSLSSNADNALSFSNDANSFYCTISGHKFYLIFDSTNSQWKYEQDYSNGYYIKNSSYNNYLLAYVDEDNNKEIQTVTDTSYASIWYYESGAWYAFAGSNKLYLALDGSANIDINKLIVSLTKPTYTFDNNIQVSLNGISNIINYYQTTSIINEQTVTIDNFDVTHSQKFTINDGGSNNLSVNGTTIVNSTDSSTSRKWIIVNSTLVDSTISTGDSGKRLIVTICGLKTYVLASSNEGALYLHEITDFTNSSSLTNYYWYQDSLGYYTVVDGINMYLNYTGTDWKTVIPPVYISKYNTTNYLSMNYSNENSPSLPSQYIELEYIESTGSQYINTGITTSDNNTIELKVYYDTPTALFGCNKAGWATNSAVYYSNGNYVRYLTSNNYYNAYETGLQTIVYSSSNVTINGVVHNYTTDTNGTTGDLVLFKSHYSSTVQYGSYKLYYAKIYNGTTLVRNFVPCFNTATSQAGLYDLVSNLFFENSGSNSFYMGSEVNNNLQKNISTDLVEIEYIESSGSQYLNTGVTPNQDYSIDTTYSITKFTSAGALWCSRGSNTNVNTYTTFVMSSKKVRVDYYNTTSNYASSSVKLNTKYTFTRRGNKFYINDNLNCTDSVNTFTAGSPIYLFASTTNGTAFNNYLYAKLYGCRIYDNNYNLIKYYVPCYKKSTQEYGLYDYVSKSFLAQGSTTKFTGSYYEMISNVDGTGTKTEWIYNSSNSTLYTLINDKKYYLTGNIDGTLNITTTSTVWTKETTTNGVAFKTQLTMPDGNLVTYSLTNESGTWKLLPVKYTNISYGSNYLSINTSGTIYNSTSNVEESRIYLSNENVVNGTGGLNTLLYVVRNGQIRYISFDTNTYEIVTTGDYFGNSWTWNGNVFTRTINGIEYAIEYVDGIWELECTQYYTIKINSVYLGISGTSFANTLTKFKVDSSNRLYYPNKGVNYYINFTSGQTGASGLTISTSTTNAMLYDSSNNRVYLGDYTLYYDYGNNNWNVAYVNSFRISSGTYYLKVTGTSSYANSDANGASYFILSDLSNNSGTLSTYYNGRLVYLNVDGSLQVSSSGISWKKREGANGTAGVLDSFTCVYDNAVYGLMCSSGTWSVAQINIYKISNSSTGSGNSFLSHVGTKTGDASSTLAKYSKDSATLWIFAGAYPDLGGADFYIGQYLNEKLYFLGYRTNSVGTFKALTVSETACDDWGFDGKKLYVHNSKVSTGNDFYIDYSSSNFYNKRSSNTELYYFPNTTSLSFTTFNYNNHKLTFSNVNTTSNCDDSINSITSEITIDYSRDFTGVRIASFTIINNYFSKIGNSLTQTYSTFNAANVETVDPNATMTYYYTNSNTTFDIYPPSDDQSYTSGTQINDKLYNPTNIVVDGKSDIPSLNLIKTTDKPFAPEIQDYQRGSYIALRLATQENGSYYSDYRADDKNTGYIVGGDYSAASTLGQGDIRVSSYPISNISNSYSSGAFSTIYTFNDSGLTAINDSANSYTEYERTKTEFLQTLNSDSSNVYGLHFMDTTITKEHLITAESVLINGKNYVNYQLPESCIDFHVYQKGKITLFAGDYYSLNVGFTSYLNSCFFSLNQIFRNESNEITDIKEIVEIYEKTNGTQKDAYIYKYSDGSYSSSKITSASDLSNYTSIFNLEWLTNPNNNTGFNNSRLYYYEIPCNKGEYALGSVNGRDGGYLLYLDIASNGNFGGNYNQDAGVTDNPLFTQVDYRDTGSVINSPVCFSYTVPSNNTSSNFKVTTSFDGEYIYTISITNRTGNSMDLSVLLSDNDDDPDNVLPYEYRIIYNGSPYTSGTNYNESNGTYASSSNYNLPAQS